MVTFRFIAGLCFVSIIAGFIISTIVWDRLNEHKFEIVSAIILFWPLLIVICVVILIFSVVVGAFEGLYYIVKSLIKEE